MHIFKNISSSTKIIGVMLVLLSLSFESFGAGTTIEETLEAFNKNPICRNNIRFTVGLEGILDGIVKAKNPGTVDGTVDDAVEGHAEVLTYVDMVKQLRAALGDTEEFGDALSYEDKNELICHICQTKRTKILMGAVNSCFQQLCNRFGQKDWFKDAVKQSKQKADEEYEIET